MTESTSHVEQQVQARIEQARTKVQAAKRQRDELSAARRRGIAARHANKLRHLAEQEQRAQQQTLDDDGDGLDDEDDQDQPTPETSGRRPAAGQPDEGAAP